MQWVIEIHEAFLEIYVWEFRYSPNSVSDSVNIPSTQLMHDWYSIDANIIYKGYLILILYAQSSPDHPVISLKLNSNLQKLMVKFGSTIDAINTEACIWNSQEIFEC